MKLKLSKLGFLFCLVVLAFVSINGFAEDKKKELSDADKKTIAEGEKIYKQYCFTCHGQDGKGTPMGPNTMAPSLIKSDRVLGSTDILIRIVMDGLTGPVDGKKYALPMTPTRAMYDDEKLSQVLSFIRNNKDWDQSAGMVSKEAVAKIRESDKGRGKMWTLEELNKKYGKK